MQSGLVLRVIGSLCLVAAARAGAQNSESVAILGCRRAAADEVRRMRVTADSVLFTLYPQVFPRTQFETDLVDYGQYFDRVQRVWVAFTFGCTYNYQTSVARVSITYASSADVSWRPLAPRFAVDAGSADVLSRTTRTTLKETWTTARAVVYSPRRDNPQHHDTKALSHLAVSAVVFRVISVVRDTLLRETCATLARGLNFCATDCGEVRRLNHLAAVLV